MIYTYSIHNTFIKDVICLNKRINSSSFSIYIDIFCQHFKLVELFCQYIYIYKSDTYMYKKLKQRFGKYNSGYGIIPMRNISLEKNHEDLIYILKYCAKIFIMTFMKNLSSYGYTFELNILIKTTRKVALVMYT